MKAEDAKRIIHNNYKGEHNSFLFFLHEKNCFSKEAFWEFYESITAMVLCVRFLSCRKRSRL